MGQLQIQSGGARRDSGRGECQKIVAENGSGEIVYCNRATLRNSSYCAKHHAMIYQKSEPIAGSRLGLEAG